MELKEFLSKNNIILENRVLELCQDGIEMMKGGIDPFHDENHVYRILNDLDRFLNESQEVEKDKINFGVLLAAICWHDAWKSRKFSSHWPSYLFQLFWDGLGSMRIFAGMAKENGFDHQDAQSVKYAIRKHSRFQFLSTKTIEAKILKSLDNLDFWSLERLEKAAREVAKNGWISRPVIRTARLFLRFIKFINRSSFYFEWSKKEGEKRKEIYFEGAKNIINRHQAEYFKKRL